MSKVIPLSRNELMRGGGVLSASRTTALDFCMAANTEIEFLAAKEKELSAEIYRVWRAGGDGGVTQLKLELEREKTIRRKITVGYEIEKVSSHGQMFKSRAKKILPAETYKMIAAMAGADSKQLEDSVAIPHDEDAL